jgi:hypothetical protein
MLQSRLQNNRIHPKCQCICLNRELKECLALLNVPNTYMHKVGQFNYQNIWLWLKDGSCTSDWLRWTHSCCQKSWVFASTFLHGHSKATLPCIMSSSTSLLKKKLLKTSRPSRHSFHQVYFVKICSTKNIALEFWIQPIQQGKYTYQISWRKLRILFKVHWCSMKNSQFPISRSINTSYQHWN